MDAPAETVSFADPYSEFVGPPFPFDVLPPTLRNFVDAEHHAMGADVSAIAMAELTVIAGAVHAETFVRVGDGWWEKPIIWTALVGNPSTMKSPIIDKVAKPLHRIDNERRKQWELERDLLKNNQDPKCSPPPPKPARCIIMDATPEKIAELLARDPCGSLMVHDELAGWMSGFERYSSGGSSRAFHLMCWKGGTFLRDRIGKGKNDPDAETYVENVALSVLGGIQPDRLEKLGDLTSDGLLQRFLPILMRPAERGDETYLVAEQEEKYQALIKSINAALPRKYHFGSDASEVLSRVLDYIHSLETLDGFSPALIGAVGKLRGYFARLCLVLQIAAEHDMVLTGVELPDSASEGGPISRQTAEAVERVLREFLLPHIFALYDVLANGGQERDKVRTIADFILASDHDRLRPSDFTSGVRSLRGEPVQKVAEWAGRFCAMGWLEPEDHKAIIPKAWLVMRGLRGHFADRRKRAQATRALAHAILVAGGSRRRAEGAFDKSA